MTPVELKGKNVPITLWTRGADVEWQALDQPKNVAALPWVRPGRGGGRAEAGAVRQGLRA